MTKLRKILLLSLASIAFYTCEKKTEPSYSEFEQKVFYELFPELSDMLYTDTRIIATPPPPPPEYLTKLGFNAADNYAKAFENWKKSDDYQKKANLLQNRQDSILNTTTEITIAFPDSIIQFEKEDAQALINHFKEQKLVVDTLNFKSHNGFKVNFANLKSNNELLLFRPISQFPKNGAFWTTTYKFNFSGSMSFTRILFDKTKTYGVLNAGFVKGRLNGGGCRIFIRKDENGNWKIDKIKETWVS
ncbi:hypothetical protein [Croceivirga radicis]|uniref:hypothetical protein n=1 Tax=Croceivirga radicis TaxID=1929488 RepID=UPI000255ADD7|nr:hypothetical protein [Croceivirga radicis]